MNRKKMEFRIDFKCWKKVCCTENLGRMKWQLGRAQRRSIF